MVKSFIKKVIFLLKRCLNEPAYFLNLFTPLLRGTFYVLYYRIVRRNVKIGFPFMASGSVKIIGQGHVQIGRRCTVFKNVFKGLTIITFNKNASIKIGNNCALGGLTIRCHTKVEIGDKTMTAISLIQDIFLCNLKRLSGPFIIQEPKPVVIGKNIWLGAGCIVMGASVIGDDSVISAGSWCHNTCYTDYSLIMGNPSCKSLPIEKLLRFKRSI